MNNNKKWDRKTRVKNSLKELNEPVWAYKKMCWEGGDKKAPG